MPIPVNTQSGMAAMGQMAQVGQAASSSAANFARAEETYASTANKMADFQMKMREISQKDMELDVMKQQQAGKMAEAERYTARNVNMNSQIEGMKKADIAKFQTEAIKSMAGLQDAERQALVPLAERVDDAQSHAQSYQRFAEVLDIAGKTPEDLGVEKGWQGNRSVDQWMTIQNSAAATGSILEAERLKSKEHRDRVKLENAIKENRIEQDYYKFSYQNYLQNQRLQATAEQNRHKAMAESGVVLKRSDYRNTTIAGAKSEAGPQIESILTAADIDAEEGELAGYVTKVASNSLKIFDGQMKNYLATQDLNMLPEEMSTIVQREVSRFVGRIGTDGNVYPAGSAKLAKQKEEWMRAEAYTPEFKARVDRRNLNPQQAGALLEALWLTPTARWGE